jgi:N-hydroxyarylamine O-acetyltransferase
VLAPDLVGRYLSRLGLAPDDVTVDAAGLTLVHEAHLRRVPFENLSIHLDERILLTPEAVVSKLLGSRRGGFCYELNGALGALLAALGFTVTLLEGRVYAEGEPGIPFDHLCLRVDLDRPYLVDVGFGASFARPLRLDTSEVQQDPNGAFSVVPTPRVRGWWDLWWGERAQYRFSLEPHSLADFAAGCEYHQTSPDSPFTRNSLCSLPVDGGRVTLAGRLLVIRDGSRRRELTVDDDAELLAAYREHFGIVLDRVPPR